MKRPKVTINCVASLYQASNERIIEYSFGQQSSAGAPLGGLISFRELEDGTCLVSLYRHDTEVQIHVGSAEPM